MTAGGSLPDMVFGHVKSAELGRARLAVNYAETFDRAFLDQFHGGPLRQSTSDGGDVHQGRALMLYTGAWAPAIFAAEATEGWNGNHSVQKVPVVTADGVRCTGNGSGEGWGVAAGNPNRDLTPEFIQRIRSPELCDRVQAALGGLPAMTGAADQVTDPVVGEVLG